MKVTLDIKDNKADFFMELIRNLSFVKKIEASDEPSKKELLKELKQAITELSLIEQGKLKAKPAKEFVNQ